MVSPPVENTILGPLMGLRNRWLEMPAKLAVSAVTVRLNTCRI